jgi:tRNA threonylcarbamoyladenosine biosynthesis protein TsaE
MANHESQLTAEWSFVSQSEIDTESLATRLADVLVSGAVVALVGNLGAGKTRLVRAVAEALGVDPRAVASPTFVLVHEYEGRLPIFHFDIYRLRNDADFLELGADEYFNSGGVCLVEWADRVESLLPADYLRIEIAVTGHTSREFRFSARGPKSAVIVHGLQSAGASRGQ